MISDGAGSPFLDTAAGKRVEAALTLLAQAWIYAADARIDPWIFAVEIACLEKQGLTTTDLRWLVCKGYLLHGADHPGSSPSRWVRPLSGLCFTAQSCFIITPIGLELLKQNEKPKLVAQAPPLAPARPFWDNDRQELRFGGVLIKRFRLPAPNQKLVLATFQEENWPCRIDDPLPPHAEIDPKRRLHHTLIALNRNQKQEAIRFQGDGSGQGVCWELSAQRRDLNAGYAGPELDMH